MASKLNRKSRPSIETWTSRARQSAPPTSSLQLNPQKLAEQVLSGADIERYAAIAEARNLRPTEQTEVESASTSDTSPRDEIKIIDLPKFSPIVDAVGESFAAMQEWEGLVTQIEGDTIYADLIDLTNGETIVSDTAEIQIDSVPFEQRDRVAIGSLFRWAVGYRRDAGGTKKRDMMLYFMRSTAQPRDALQATPPLEFERKVG